MPKAHLKFVVAKPIKVGAGDLEVGAEVPEAIDWSVNAVLAMFQQGQITVEDSSGRISNVNEVWAKFLDAQKAHNAQKGNEKAAVATKPKALPLVCHHDMNPGPDPVCSDKFRDKCDHLADGGTHADCPLGALYKESKGGPDGDPDPVTDPVDPSAPEDVQCSATTASDNQCSRMTSEIYDGSPYCPQHLAAAKKAAEG